MQKFLGLVTIFSLAANAGATEWHNLGARAMGMGGAAVALPNGAMSAYWNPAALGAPDNTNGLQAPAGVHLGVTGEVLRAANDLNNIEDACRASAGAQTGDCNQAKLDQAINDLNANGAGVRGDVGGGLNLKVGRLALFANNFTYVGAKPLVSYNNVSITNVQSNNSSLLLRGISTTEFGAGYGRELAFAPGVFLGGTAKVMAGRVGFSRVRVVDEDVQLGDFTNNDQKSVQMGFDVGSYWDLGRTFENARWHPRLGLTARNINNPKFKNPSAAVALGAQSKYSMHGAVRAGLAVSPLPFWNIAVDGDLTRNLTALEGVASQQLGVGTEINVFNRSWINIPLRAGLSRNLAQGGKNSLSLGVGMNLIHMNVDVGVTSSPRTQQVQSSGKNEKYPNELQGGVQLAFLFGGSALKPESTKGNFETK